jgi:hypothetical protein
VTAPEDKSGLESIPGVGPSIARDLRRLGGGGVDAVGGRDPPRLYDELEGISGAHVDRCVLYAFRCAVHYAGEPEPDGELTTWWNWKDGGLAQERGLF